MVSQAKEMLTGSLIPFWRGLRDDEEGGFYGFLGFDLKLDKKAEKGCILNSRILWFFSNAYLSLGDSSCLNDAKHAYDFMRKYCIDSENGGVYWSVNCDGSTADSTKHTYNQAFAVYALASYYEASKDREALDLAFEIFHIIETKCTVGNGYGEAFDRTFKPVSNEKLSENGVIAARTMNTLLHIFEAYSGLYHAQKNDEVEKCLRHILEIYATKIFNPQKNRLEVFFDENMNSIIDLHSYGHDIEASWLVDWGTQLLGDEILSKKIAAINSSLAQKIIECAYHERSLWYECEKGVNVKYREWWVQAEALGGFLHEHQKHPEKKEFLEAAHNVMAYIREYFVDKRKGSEWFARVDESGKPYEDQAIVQPWKCPYHNGRMCFEILRKTIRPLPES
ncbi:MAG: AGE family epimerase/isomerase [Treponema sp.]|jgi:mannobiose 2-epimerase|nr:AGE family epimerase/isomerase [Treponema sp.]